MAGFTARCERCGAQEPGYATEELAQAACVEHVARLHPQLYQAVCCVNGRHGSLCNRSHRFLDKP